MTKNRFWVVTAALGASALTGLAARADVLNFDDITVVDQTNGDSLPSSYHGFNFGQSDGTFFIETDADYQDPSHYNNSYGAPSAPNAIANNGGAGLVTISNNVPFVFNGADFAAFAQSNGYTPTSDRNVTLTGYLGGIEVGSPMTFRLSPSKYTFESVDFGGPIDTLQIDSNPASVGDASYYLLDNFTYNASVPEPASLAVLGCGAMLLFRRSRRA